MKAKITGFTLLIFGLTCIVIAGLMFRSPIITSSQPPVQVTTQAQMPTQIVRCPDSLPASQKVGCEFESWVLSRFEPRIFTPETWNRSGSLENLATGSGIPDLYFKFRTESRRDSFHVECVYRTALIDGHYSWGNDDKVIQLKQFASSNSEPVFLVLGLGGTPQSPNSVWVIRLSDKIAGKIRLRDMPPARPLPDNSFKYNSYSRHLM